MRIIAGMYRGKTLKIPQVETTRPTADLVKTSLFNILQGEIDGAVVLDLFAGSGALGLEAISRGAKQVFFVENNKECFKTLKSNCDSINGEKTLYSCDCLEALYKIVNLKIKFDLVFLDPPYKSGLELKALTLLKQLNLLSINAIIVVEQDEFNQVDYSSLIEYDLCDTRKYGRKKLYFLKLKQEKEEENGINTK